MIGLYAALLQFSIVVKKYKSVNIKNWRFYAETALVDQGGEDHMQGLELLSLAEPMLSIRCGAKCECTLYGYAHRLSASNRVFKKKLLLKNMISYVAQIDCLIILCNCNCSYIDLVAFH